MENYTTGTGQKLKVHDRAVCSAIQRGRGDCVIHQRADTHMKDWPTNWRTSWGGFMEVICPHGVGHPAPEEMRKGGMGHGCDGCCSTPPDLTLDPDFRYRPGGLMRCCLVTLGKAYEPQLGTQPLTIETREGDKLPCAYCSSVMIFTEGAWEWDKSRAPVNGVPIPTKAELAP